jgi:hypothetical protein
MFGWSIWTLDESYVRKQHHFVLEAGRILFLLELFFYWIRQGEVVLVMILIATFCPLCFFVALCTVENEPLRS